MSIFFMDAAGSNTAPYDTIEKAASTLQELVYGGGTNSSTAKVTFSPGDIFEVSSSGGEFFEDYFPVLALPTDVIMRSYSGNILRPIYRLLKGLNLAIEGGKVTNIDFYKEGSGGGPVVSSFIGLSGIDPVISGCSFDIVNPEGGWVSTSCITAVGNAPVPPIGAVIVNNLIQNIGGQGIELGSSGTALNTVVMNNTLYNTNMNTPDRGMFFITNTGDRCAGSIIANNICLGTESSASGTVGIQIIDVNLTNQNYNCISGVTEYSGVATKGPKNIHADPKFVDVPSGDFKLSYNSPCVNTGAGIGQYPSAPTTDIRNVTRPQISFGLDSDYYGTDIGCYEMPFSEFDFSGNGKTASGATSTVFPTGLKGAIRFISRFDPKTLRQVGLRQTVG